MALLTIHNLSHHFTEEMVLKDINIEIEQGEVVVLLGSSGSGKSTLLRCINQLHQPTAGSLQLGDLAFQFPVKKPDKKQLQKLRLQAGMVFQHFHLWPHKTVLQNLMIAPMRVLKWPKQQALEKAESLLNKVGLLDKQDVYPAALSGGQQQRVAITRSLMMHPALLLMDEPTSALDPENVAEVLNTIKTLASAGMTMVIATHELAFAKQVATQVIFLQQGRIVESGGVELLEQPQTQRLSAFLGIH